MYSLAAGYVVAGAQASKHFKLLVKCRNGSGSPWVKWIAHCPRYSTKEYLMLCILVSF